MGNPVYIDATPDPRPGSRGYLRWYWTLGPGLAKWAKSPHPWTALYTHLVKFMEPELAKRVTTVWFHQVTGFYPSTPHIGIVRTGK